MAEEIKAELVANIAKVTVEVGQQVEPGATIVILESMKMEIPVLCEHGGTISAVHVTEGDVVQEGDVIAEIA